MGRLKIEMPANILVIVNIPVRITDINYGNHVGNDSLVSIIHEARVLWLKSLQSTELNVAGAGLIMSDLSVEYMNESFYGDVLNISIAAGEISRAGFELFYSLQAKRDEKNILIAKAKTGMVCYDYSKKRVMAVPDKLRNILAGIYLEKGEELHQ